MAARSQPAHPIRDGLTPMANLDICPQCGARIPPGPEAEVCPRCGRRLAPPEVATPQGTAAGVGPSPRSFGKFELREKLGSGPTGTVWKVVHGPSAQPAALKLLRNPGSITAAQRARFRHQAAKAARLHEPHVARLLDAGEEGGELYVVSQFIQGQPVTAWARTEAAGAPPGEALGEAEAARLRQGRIAVLFAKVARALHAAHLTGVPHLNLKPANLLVDTNDEPQVLDFCLTPLQDKPRPVQEETPGRWLDYRAPEQLAGQPGSPLADVYSLGLILAEALTGRRPPAPASGGHADALEADLVAAGVDAPLREVIRHTLDRWPAHRLHSALAVAEALEEAAANELRVLLPAQEPKPTTSLRAKLPLWAAITGGATLLALGMMLLKPTMGPEQRQSADALASSDDGTADLQRAEAAESAGDIAMALRHHAHALRLDPYRAKAATSVVSLLTFRTHPLPRMELDAVEAAAFAGDGGSMALARPDGPIEIRRWPIQGTPEQQVPHSSPVRSMLLDHPGHWLALVLHDESAEAWNLEAQPQQMARVPPGAAILTLAFDTNAAALLTVRADGLLGSWPLATAPETTLRLQVKPPLHDAEFAQDHRRLLVVDSSGQVHLLDPASGRALEPGLDLPARVLQARFSPEGHRVLTSDESGIRLWSTTGGVQGVPLAPPGETLAANPFSPEGGRILTVSASTGDAFLRRLNPPLAASEPLRHLAGLRQLAFHPDAQHVLTIDRLARARIWDVRPGSPPAVPSPTDSTNESTFLEAPPPTAGSDPGIGNMVATQDWPLPTPEWLPLLAEAVAGSRLEDVGKPPVAPVLNLSALQNRLRIQADSDPWSDWARWFLADRSARPLAPGGRRTVPEWIQELMTRQTEPCLREALLWTPTNADLSALLAIRIAANPHADPDSEAEAAWHAQRALALTPQAVNARLAAQVWSERQKSIPGTPQLSPTALQLESRSPAQWINEGRTWWQSNRWPEAVLAYTRAIELLDRQGKGAAAQARLYRSAAYRLLGLHWEAGRDNCLARGLTIRPAATPRQLVDLSAHYNAALRPNWHNDRPGNDLAELPTGSVTLAGVDFDVRGLIQLQALAGAATHYPVQVTNILVHRPCRYLHFLHAATNGKDTPQVQIGTYRLHYADGDQRDLAVVLGDQLRDWWNAAATPPLAPGTTVAWLGANAVSRPLAAAIALFRTTWENPLPNKELTSIDIQSARSGPGLFVVAITVE